MPIPPRELHDHLVRPQIAAPVVICPVQIADPGTSDATIVVFVATRKCSVLRASYLQTANATAATTYVAQLRNGSTNVSAALDIKALGADAGADFVITDANAILEDGDILDIVFDETGGTVTAPGIVALCLELQLLE